MKFTGLVLGATVAVGLLSSAVACAASDLENALMQANISDSVDVNFNGSTLNYNVTPGDITAGTVSNAFYLNINTIKTTGATGTLNVTSSAGNSGTTLNLNSGSDTITAPHTSDAGSSASLTTPLTFGTNASVTENTGNYTHWYGLAGLNGAPAGSYTTTLTATYSTP